MRFLMILLTLLISTGTVAQNKVIYGNGKIKTIKRPLDQFSTLSIDLKADVIVESGAMPLIEITADKNIVRKIDFSLSGKKLQLKVKDGYWLQSTKPRIKIQTPYLVGLTTLGHQTGIGDIVIKSIDVDRFNLDVLYGDIQLEGKVDKLLIKSSNQSYYKNSGTIDASKLTARVVKANIKGSNSAIVYPTEILVADLKHDAEIKYDSEPNEIELKGEARLVQPGLITVSEEHSDQTERENEYPKVALQYVTLKVKNNSLARKHFKIRGPNPSGDKFSYGFPMMPMATREKRVPVGTNIYLQKNGLMNKKLVTITSEDDGKVLDLFK